MVNKSALYKAEDTREDCWLDLSVVSFPRRSAGVRTRSESTLKCVVSTGLVDWARESEWEIGSEIANMFGSVHLCISNGHSQSGQSEQEVPRFCIKLKQNNNKRISHNGRGNKSAIITNKIRHLQTGSAY